MARGWESKAVEDQIAAKDEDFPLVGKSTLTPEEVELRSRRDGLMLVRTRTLRDLGGARDPKYRALLERTLAHLDAELARFEDEQ